MIKYLLKRFIRKRISQFEFDMYSLTIDIEYSKCVSEEEKDKKLKIHNKLVEKKNMYKLILEDLE